MADPHLSHEAMSPSESDAYDAGTGGPTSGWKAFLGILLAVFALAILLVIWTAWSGLSG